MRWSEFLSRFNFKLVYRPGSINTRPDALTRRSQDIPKDVHDDRLKARRIPLIPASKFGASFAEALSTMRLYALDISRPIDDLITESYNASPVMALMLNNLENPVARKWHPEIRGTLRIAFAECRAVAGRIYFRGRLVVPPDDEALQLQILHRTHNSAPAGHPAGCVQSTCSTATIGGQG